MQLKISRVAAGRSCACGQERATDRCGKRRVVPVVAVARASGGGNNAGDCPIYPTTR